MLIQSLLQGGKEIKLRVIWQIPDLTKQVHWMLRKCNSKMFKLEEW